MENNTARFVDGYEGLYQVTSDGRVISLPKGDGNGGRKRELKFDLGGKANKQYRRVTLSKNGKAKRFAVHRLVAIAFIPNPDKKPCVNHIDSNQLNNRSENLEWVTHSENSKHAVKHGNQMAVCLAGSKAASMKNLKKTTDKFKRILGARFVDCNHGKYGNMVKFKCLHCSEEIERRVNSKLLKRGGICAMCWAKVKPGL